MNFKQMLREPLIHFLVLGAGLFLISSLRRDAGDRPDRIVVTAGQFEHLALIFQRTWQRPPTSQELQGLIDDHIKDEIFYREAVAQGLDRDDIVIRRRLRQKMELISEDVASVVEPTEQELEAFLAQNADKFRQEPLLTFHHIYLSRDRRGETIASDAERLLHELKANPNRADDATLGDPFLLQSDYELASAGEVARLFGEEFAGRLLQLEPQQWTGPVASSYGLHLVLVRERKEGRMPELTEVREAVQREWFAARRKELGEASYQRLRARYSVTVETPEWAKGVAQSGSLKTEERQ